MNHFLWRVQEDARPTRNFWMEYVGRVTSVISHPPEVRVRRVQPGGPRKEWAVIATNADREGPRSPDLHVSHRLVTLDSLGFLMQMVE
jgi:hypothetical protein